jgi:hypothetical protein
MWEAIMNTKLKLLPATLLVAFALSSAALAGPGLKGTSVPIEGGCDVLGVVLAQPPGTTGMFGTLTFSNCEYAAPVDLVSAKAHVDSWVAGPPSGGFLPIVGSTHITYTGASGDRLDSIFTFSGKLNLAAPPGTNNLVWQGTEIYQGGTGKYAQATGTSTVFGSTNLVTQEGEFEAFGLINF